VIEAAVELCSQVGKAAVGAISVPQLLRSMEKSLFLDVLSSSDPAEVPSDIADILAAVYSDAQGHANILPAVRSAYQRIISTHAGILANPVTAAIFVLEEAVSDGRFDVRDAREVAALPWGQITLTESTRDFPQWVVSYLHENEEGFAPDSDDNLLNKARQAVVELRTTV